MKDVIVRFLETISESIRIWMKFIMMPKRIQMILINVIAQLIWVCGLVILMGGITQAEQQSIKITVDSAAHTDYGLSYPITYKFSIPAVATNLTAYEKKALSDAWTQLPTKTTDDFFNGINAVRFDYTNDFAYVSVAFGDTSDIIYLIFKDSTGTLLSNVSFVKITDYYDNRVATCVITADDWIDDRNMNFKDVCDAHQSRQIWLSPGLVTGNIGSSTWLDIQADLDEGYVEPVAHSRTHPCTHPCTPYDYDSEINGSKQDIIDNLNLPALNKKGSTEYVYAWTAPCSCLSAGMMGKLGTYRYLESTGGNFSTNYGSFPSWDSTNGLYEAWNRYGYAEDETEAAMNSQWDTDYTAGNIYHLGRHPHKLNLTPGSNILNHLDYIKGKKDVWYVGMGHLFVYHYVKERNKVEIETIPDNSLPVELSSFTVTADDRQVTLRWVTQT